jgi:hypothetical protein
VCSLVGDEGFVRGAFLADPFSVVEVFGRSRVDSFPVGISGHVWRSQVGKESCSHGPRSVRHAFHEGPASGGRLARE